MACVLLVREIREKWRGIIRFLYFALQFLTSAKRSSTFVAMELERSEAEVAVDATFTAAWGQAALPFFDSRTISDINSSAHSYYGNGVGVAKDKRCVYRQDACTTFD